MISKPDLESHFLDSFTNNWFNQSSVAFIRTLFFRMH